MRKMHKTNGLNADAKHTRAKSVIVEKVKRRPMSGPLEASTQAAVSQPANCNGGKVSTLRRRSPENGNGEWELADAILAECSETGRGRGAEWFYAKMEAMRQEIATNHGVELSFERIRKLRKVASAFPPGRRRPAVSLEGHLEAGTPEALDAFINSAPNGTTAHPQVHSAAEAPGQEGRAGPAEGRTPPPARGTTAGVAKGLQAARTRKGASAISSTPTSAAAWAKSPSRFAAVGARGRAASDRRRQTLSKRLRWC